MVSLNCIETVREEKAGRLQVRLRQTCTRHEDVDCVLAELDVADFEEHALGNLLRQLSVASAQRQAEHSAAAVAGRANALALQEENGDGRSEMAGASMAHGDGEPRGMTAMAKTVGLPAAIAVKMILNGDLALTGCHIPTHKAIYEPVLKELAAEGITFTEEVGLPPSEME